MSLSSVASLQGLPGIVDAGYDISQLSQAIDAASEAIKRYCNRPVLEEQAIAALYLSGNGMPDLVCPHYPITSIDHVYYDPQGYYGKRAGSFPAGSEIFEGADFVVVQDGAGIGPQGKSGLIRRIAGGTSLAFALSDWWGWGGQRGTLTARQAPYWPRGYGNIKLANVKAGFNPIPADLIQACNQLAAWLLRSGQYGGQALSSESLNGYSYGLTALQTQPLLGETRQLLSRFREVAVGLGN